MSFKLASNKRELACGIKTFDKNIPLVPDHPIYAQAGKYKCWYGIKDEKGHWIFGPSKFIGYAGMDIDTYIDYQQELDGKATEKQLSKFSEVVSDKQYDQLLGLLIESLSRVNRTPGKSVKIKIIEIEMETKNKPVRYKNTKDFDFYTQIETENYPTLVSSFIVVGNRVKFDLLFGSNHYFVELNRVNEGAVYSGHAVRQFDNHNIKCRALLEFNEDQIEIHGIEWLEDGKDFRWSAYVEEANDA